MAYATLDDAKRELDAQNNDDDDDLLWMLDVASNRVDRVFGNRWEPYKETRTFYIRQDRVHTWERLFYLDRWFLVLNSVTVYNSSLTVGTDVEAYPNGYAPYRILRLKSTGEDWYTSWVNTDYPPLVYVGADWGFRPHYTTEGWRYSNDVVTDAGGINATVATVTVGNADGLDWQGRTPRFSAGQLIRIESEWLRVLATDTTLNTLTVRRGENGSTAAAHALNTQIYAWYPEDVIRHMVGRHAALMYKRRGAFDIPQGDFGGASYPRDLEAEMLGILQGYMHYVGP